MKGLFNSGVVFDVFSQSSFKHWLVLVIFWNPIHKRILFAIAFVGLLGAFQLAQAELDNTVEFNIVAQPLGSALLQFSEQADVQLVVAAKNLEGIVTNGIKGMAKVGYALESLLANTGLEYRTIGDTVTVSMINIEGSQDSEEPPLTSGGVNAAQIGALESQTDESPVSRKKRFDRFRLEEVVVLGERVVVRNRSNTTEPELTYSAEYFERFEPLTVSDMLKRVPGVFFDRLFNLPDDTIDNEADGEIGEPRGTLPRLRNLDGAFTQILVNGRHMAGIDLGSGGGDGFFATIPAEAVKEIKVIRSPSADIDSSGVGMTLNIILKDGAMYQSNSWRLAGVSYDGETKGLGSLYMAGSTDRFNYSIGLTYQDRPTGGTIIEDTTDPFDPGFAKHRETDLRQLDEDRNFIGNIGFDVGKNGHLKFEGQYFTTDTESFSDYERVSTSVCLPSAPCTGFSNSETVAENKGLTAIYYYDADNFSWQSELGWNTSDIDSFIENRIGTHPGGSNSFMTRDTVADSREYLFKNHFSYRFSDTRELLFGIDWRDISSESSVQGTSILVPGWSISADQQDIERLDLYAIYEMELGANVNLQVGGRYETAKYDSSSTATLEFRSSPLPAPGFTFDPVVLIETDRQFFAAKVGGFNPSIHLKWAMADNHDLRVSVAQTVRRPNLAELDPRFNFWYINDPSYQTINPRLIYGNSELDNETALGLDVGYDWYFENGVFGINVYYRDIDDKIIQRQMSLDELYQVSAEVGAEFERFLQFQDDNMLPGWNNPPSIISSVNSSNVTTARGVELDLSIPVRFISENANFYFNATYAEIETTNEAAENSTAINFGYDHFIESIGFTYGFSYNQITDFYSKYVNAALYDETVILDKQLDPNVEVFVEKKFGPKLLARLSIENILDAKETVFKSDRLRLEFLNYGRDSLIVTDTAPRFVLTLRGSF